ncbi:GNAT family N-acetyltransferase [Halovenus halobia]|uniref:GNAT family N-acetyltransferase n=1 Tax=Halovenus halobia TaxID=3396622 RepID=UPI003F57D86D
MTTFRRVSASDRRRYNEILRYAFAPEQGPLQDDSGNQTWPPEVTDPYGLYENDELRSTCKLYDLTAWLRTGYEQIGGLGAVATPPEDRNQGYVRALAREALAAFEERGAALVTLWPFSTEFYAQFGWTVADYRAHYECSPDLLPRADTAGQMRGVEAPDWAQLQSAERAHSEGLALSLQRSPAWWRERTLTNWDGGPEPYIYGYERDGEIDGYLVYTVDETETLSVNTLAAADERAYSALLDFLGSHGAQIDTIEFSRPTEDLLDRVERPEDVECTIKPGAMVRAPSVFALDGLGWPDAALDCTIAVSDPLEAGEHTVANLSVADGRLHVEGSDREPAVETDIGTLSTLVVGTQNTARARRLGTLTVRDDAVLDELSAAFEPQRVSLGEFF